MTQQRRQLKNVFFKPSRQIRLAMMLLAGSVALYCLYVINLLRVNLYNLEEAATQFQIPVDYFESFNRSASLSVLFVSIFGLLLTLTILALGVLVSKRIYGPMVPTVRFIKELRAGNYAARGKLRKGDEFQELMDELNGLASDLQTRVGSAN